jgi:hypothetical protein
MVLEVHEHGIALRPDRRRLARLRYERQGMSAFLAIPSVLLVLCRPPEYRPADWMVEWSDLEDLITLDSKVAALSNKTGQRAVLRFQTRHGMTASLKVIGRCYGAFERPQHSD